MTKINKHLATALLALAGLAYVAPAAKAQNPDYAFGDLIMYFQQFGGSQTVMINLGSATTYRDATSSILNIVNIGTLLSGTGGANYGANWFDDDTIYFGLAGVRSSSTGTTTHVNGDPNRTIYVSQSRTVLGVSGSATTIGYTGFTNSDMTTGATNMIGLQNVFEVSGTSAFLVSPNSSSQVDNQNPFLGENQGTAYGIFPGGVQGQFGAGSLGNLGGVNAEAGLDLYRILASTSASGQVGGPLREGTYEGSFVIDTAGSVSYINTPEPTTGALIGFAGFLGMMARRRRRNSNA